jgi:hypothetical protein
MGTRMKFMGTRMEFKDTRMEFKSVSTGFISVWSCHKLGVSWEKEACSFETEWAAKR